MSVVSYIIQTFPDLTREDFLPNGKINLKDEGDGKIFVHKWNYNQPIPENLKLGITEDEAKLLLGGN